jgi:hypothetical protein
MSPLERRYRWLLRAYPADYRAQRADEILGTLLEVASPGQRFPGARETAGLIAGAMRARATRNASLPPLAGIRLAALLASATFTGLFVAVRARQLIDSQHYGGLASAARPAAEHRALILAGLFTAVVLVWFVRRLLAVLALTAVLAAANALGLHSLKLLLITVVIATLTALRPERLPRSWLWWFVLPPGYLFLDLLGVPDGGPTTVGLRALMLAVFLLGPIAWAVTDARPALALAMLLTYLGLFGLDGGLFVVDSTAITYLCLGVLAALPFLLRTVRRRHAVA